MSKNMKFGQLYNVWLSSMKRHSLRQTDTAKLYEDVVLADVKQQVFDFKDFTELGPDLAASFMILKLKGKVYFKDIGLIDDSRMLPRKFDPNYQLIEIDANNRNLHYEGLFNFTALKNLKKLDLSFNYEIDNFCCDKLASIFYRSDNLIDLKLHGNRRITENGLVALAKIRSLKHLTVTKYSDELGTNMTNMFIELFKDHRPDIDLKVYESDFLYKIDKPKNSSWWKF